jgi:hemerythrin
LAKIEWQEVFETGIPVVDTQHQKLVAMINQLEAALQAGEEQASDEIGSVLVKLVNYTRYHFSTEEKMQEAIEFSGSEAHARQHKALIARVTSILARQEKGSAVTICEVLDLLADWLVNHILYQDKKIGPEYEQYRDKHGETDVGQTVPS